MDNTKGTQRKPRTARNSNAIQSRCGVPLPPEKVSNECLNKACDTFLKSRGIQAPTSRSFIHTT